MNVCDGMCSACGADGAIAGVARAPRRARGRERRMVVGVNDVVREPGVIGIALEQRLENRRPPSTAPHTSYHSASAVWFTASA